MAEQIIGKKGMKEEYTPEQLRVIEEYKNSTNDKRAIWVERQRKGRNP